MHRKDIINRIITLSVIRLSGLLCTESNEFLRFWSNFLQQKGAFSVQLAQG